MSELTSSRGPRHDLGFVAAGDMVHAGLSNHARKCESECKCKWVGGRVGGWVLVFAFGACVCVYVFMAISLPHFSISLSLSLSVRLSVCMCVCACVPSCDAGRMLQARSGS